MTVAEAKRTLQRTIAALSQLDNDSIDPLGVNEFYSFCDKRRMGVATKAFLAAHPGSKAEKSSDEFSFNVDIISPEGDRIAYLFGSKQNVCTVVGEIEEEYEAEIPDPSVVVPTITVKRTRTIPQWDCGTLLDAALGGEVREKSEG